MAEKEICIPTHFTLIYQDIIDGNMPHMELKEA
jgi:hypothetical protein